MAYTPFDLTGKKVLITGGNSGIGLGMAEAVAQAGADVCIWGTNEQKNEAARAELEAFGARVVALRCTVADEQEELDRLAETGSELAHHDTCFDNAGVSRHRRRAPDVFIGTSDGMTG